VLIDRDLTSFVYRRITHTVQHGFDRFFTSFAAPIVCRPTLSLTLAAGTTSARLPMTELIVAVLAHSASARTQPHLREVIVLYEQWARRDRQITGVLYRRHRTRVHRYAAIRRAQVGGGSLLWLSLTLAAKKVDPASLTRLRGGSPARLQANRYAGPSVR
jgi:hypothetical protein